METIKVKRIQIINTYDTDYPEDWNIDDIEDYQNEKRYNYFRFLEKLDNIYAQFVLQGSSKRWNGINSGITPVDSNEYIQNTISDMFKDCDYINVCVTENGVYCAGSHHDGDVNFVVKPLKSNVGDVWDMERKDFDNPDIYEKINLNDFEDYGYFVDE